MAILPTSQAAAEIESPDRPKRKHLDATSPANSTKRQRTPGSLDHVNPLGIRPLGNLLLSSTPSCRGTGLGSLAALPDELLLLLFSEVPLEDLHRLQGVSRTFFAWCAGLDSLWKAGFIERAHGRLGDTWAGSWRETYLRVFLLNGRQSPTSDTDPGTGRLCVRCEGVFSDVLFQPIMCAQFAFDSLVRSPTFRPNISCVSVHSITSLPMQPLILTDAMSNWDAYSSMASSRWSLDSLAARFPDVLFRAEATLTTLSDYSRYQASCFSDESPLYLFDSDFVEKTEGCEAPGMGRGFEVPKVFSEDLFSVLGDKRPDFRWLIVGPARSGSTWHQDPNHTSAWNAPITGSKMWILFPPHVLPPGVRTSPDMGEVECPLSIAEWFLGGYYDEAKEQFGEHGKEEKGAMKIGICRAGEIFYVPSGWWHLVVNLEPSIAITQNFVSSNELAAVLFFMKHRPSHVSGFRLRRDKAVEHGEAEEADEEEDECGTEVYESFVEAMKSQRPETLDHGLRGLAALEAEAAKAKVKVNVLESSERTAKVDATEGDGGFAFDFAFD